MGICIQPVDHLCGSAANAATELNNQISMSLPGPDRIKLAVKNSKYSTDVINQTRSAHNVQISYFSWMNVPNRKTSNKDKSIHQIGVGHV